MSRREKIVKSRTNWRKADQVKRLRIIMTVVMVALCISVAAGAALVWLEVKKPFSNTESSSMPTSQSQKEELPVYENSYSLLIVNGKKGLPEGFAADLTEYGGVQVDKRILPYLKKMLEAAKTDGVELSLSGGYVSAADQDALFEQKVQELINSGQLSRVRAEDQVQSTLGRGGYSENQTGMAVEFSGGEDFGASRQGQWLLRYAAEYGFVLRYPENKQSKTGMAYQPARYRFVGKENALRMRELGMCLEEYVTHLKKQGSY